MDIKVIVATHKKNWMPDDPLYIPIHVGREGKTDIGYIGDNTGDNISSKNPYYSELTGLYWAWKNIDSEYIGLAHYRRHFSLRKKKNANNSVLTLAEAQSICKDNDIIVPKKRKLYIETVYSHYDHTFNGEHLDSIRSIIEEKEPTYLNSFDICMQKKSVHLFNMFIMKKELFHEYCSWMFPILFELENRYALDLMDDFQRRLIGRVSERLLDVWLIKHKLSYKEINYIYFGKNNMPRKILGFILAKVFKVKYKKSF